MRATTEWNEAVQAGSPPCLTAVDQWPANPARVRLFAIAVGFVVSVSASLQVEPAGPAAPDSRPTPQVRPAAGLVEEGGVAPYAPGDTAVQETEILGFAEGMHLLAPASTSLAGYHQAGSRRALALHPRGSPRKNDNAGRFAAPAPTPGLNYAILTNRRRGTHPTSAVDLALPPDQPVPSPVTGTVTDVRPYALYGRLPDLRVVIAPRERPDLRVLLLHLDVTTVAAGDEVVAGETIVAKRGRRLPFMSQVDGLTGPGVHVHLEVRRR